MRVVLFPALIVTVILASPAAQANESQRHGSFNRMAGAHAFANVTHKGRWQGGTHAPGGWAAYRRPSMGYVLPRYWIQPSFSISNWNSFGLYQPRSGFGWSRYYDDAVLIDRYGRVADYVPDHRWDRGRDWQDDGYDDGYGYGYDDRASPRRRSSGLGGAVTGGAFGAIAGAAIAGRGNRAQGAILGGGLGAIAGAAIDQAGDRRSRVEDRRSDRRDGRYDDHGAQSGQWQGRWEGRWTPEGDSGAPVYQGTDRGTYEDGTRWDDSDGEYRVQHGRMAPPPALGYGGMVQHFHQPAPAVTTIVIHSEPVVTTTTTTEYVTEYVRAPARPTVRRAAVKKAKRPTCVCRVVYR